MKKSLFLLFILLACGLTACKQGGKTNQNMDQETLVKVETSMGDIVVKLYNETPLHRDNFIKLVKLNASSHMRSDSSQKPVSTLVCGIVR